MDSTDKFWITLWSFVLVGVIVLITSISAVQINEANRVAELVRGGSRPPGRVLRNPGDRGEPHLYRSRGQAIVKRFQPSTSPGALR